LPGEFGNGTKSFNSCVAAGLMRLEGMMLPVKGWPVSGSRIAVLPKSPRRWASERTTTFVVVPLSLR